MRNLVRVCGVVALLSLSLQVSASTLPDADRDGVPDTSDNCVSVPNTNQADSNGNGIGDMCEGAWANRDDDEDGVSNGIDNCPDEPNSDQANVCSMQAITVPAVPASPWIPHVTYSGASITLKGIARYGGNQFMWDFGDGTSPTAWLSIANPYNLGFRHTYIGAAGQLFIATLSVRDSANPSVVATATYPVKIAPGTDLTDRYQTDVRARMAVDEALWYLHVNQSRAKYADGSPGYAQAYGYWPDVTSTCVALDAMVLRGSIPSLSNRTDPYVEDVRRALSFLLAQSVVQTISTQPDGSPDSNANGYGVTMLPTSNDVEKLGICALALADSGTPDRQALTGPTNVYGRLYKEIAQETADWFSFAQNDSGVGRGGWSSTANAGSSEMRFHTFPLLALRSAERRMGATIPAFVRTNLPYFNSYTRHTSLDSLHGGWGLISANAAVGLGTTGSGMLADEFLGFSSSHAELQAGLGFFFRNWAITGDSCWRYTILGNTYAMYPATMALVGMQANRVIEYNYNTAQQTGNSFDWYYTPQGQTQTGVAKDLITRQSAAGSWSDTQGCPDLLTGLAVTALDAIILAKNPTAAPQAAICDCTATWALGSPVTLDGSCSTVTEPGRRIVNYEWDFNYDGTSFQPTLDANGLPIIGNRGTKADGFPSYGPQTVALRVTDDTPASAGGPRTSVATCNLTIQAENHCPHVDAGGPYFGKVTLGRETLVQLDAAATRDPDNDPVTYAWDLDQDGMFDDATGVNPTVAFAAPGTYVVAVRATDSSQCSAIAYVPVEIGSGGVRPPAPLAPLAAATQRNGILVLWNGVEGASLYELWRSQDGNPYSLIARTRGTAFVDSVAPDKTFLYKVRAAGTGGPSALGPPDLATSIVFTDSSLSGTPAKALHLTELRQAVAAVRVAAGLSPTALTDPAITPGVTTIKRAHVLELRTALDEARAAIGVPPLTYSDSSPELVKATHFLELRAGTQ